MAEAEDVLVDAARHATDYAQALWRRRRRHDRDSRPLCLVDIQPRLDFLLEAVHGRSFQLRVAQPPAPATFLSRLFRRNQGPRQGAALPATDGTSIWLPANLGSLPALEAGAQYRSLALRQAARAVRGSAQSMPVAKQDPLLADLYLVLEAFAADYQLVRQLPGLRAQLASMRVRALKLRPQLDAFPAHVKPLEELIRQLYTLSFDADEHQTLGHRLPCRSPAESLVLAQAWAEQLCRSQGRDGWGPSPMLHDQWLGELRPPPPNIESTADGTSEASYQRAVRSARLARRPEVRGAKEDEDDERPGAWMVQSAQPHEQAEDPMGLQRPTDRDTTTAAEEFADAMSELPEARLVTTPGQSKEVLLSDDAPERKARQELLPGQSTGNLLVYPEWDYRVNAYHAKGATVHELLAMVGQQAWVDKTLDGHRAMLHEIRRRFELLRSSRTRVRKQLDGDDVDLEAYVDAYADFRAGLTFSQRLYQTQRQTHRDMAIMLLIDVSGSTDSWVTGNRRIIDVEREALLLVCIALEGMGQPYAVQAFSGEGPQSVVLRPIKRFEETYGNSTALRIAGLEPEHYTRVGAAVRHATSLVMRQSAKHRLLLLLSDGKPNDVDQYEGRYGIEDLRQAVAEARLQGISPFCLTIDRQAASYLPFVFGHNHYALLTHPELLPKVLLDWLRRLVGS